MSLPEIHHRGIQARAATFPGSTRRPPDGSSLWRPLEAQSRQRDTVQALKQQAAFCTFLEASTPQVWFNVCQCLYIFRLCTHFWKGYNMLSEVFEENDATCRK